MPPDAKPLLGHKEEITDAASNSKCTPLPWLPCPGPSARTVKDTVAAECAGAEHTNDVDDMILASANLLFPNPHMRLPVPKCRPTTVTTCPPSPATALEGRTLSTVAATSYLNPAPELVKSEPPLLLTSNSTTPPDFSEYAGTTHAADVDDSQCTICFCAYVSPNLHTRLSALSPDPITVTILPPATYPIEGTSDSIDTSA